MWVKSGKMGFEAVEFGAAVSDKKLLIMGDGVNKDNWPKAISTIQERILHLLIEKVPVSYFYVRKNV
jgi:hypothetical protein